MWRQPGHRTWGRMRCAWFLGVMVVVQDAMPVQARPGIPTDNPIDETSKGEWRLYLLGLFWVTLGFAAILWVLGSVIMCCCCVYCWCAKRTNDTEFPSAKSMVRSAIALDKAPAEFFDDDSDGGGDIEMQKAFASSSDEEDDDSSPQLCNTIDSPNRSEREQNEQPAQKAVDNLLNEEPEAACSAHGSDHRDGNDDTSSAKDGEVERSGNCAAETRTGAQSRPRLQLGLDNLPSLDQVRSSGRRHLERVAKRSKVKVQDVVNRVFDAKKQLVARHPDHWWTFWFPAAVIMTALLLGCILIIVANRSFDGNIADAYDGTETAVHDAAAFFCRDARDPISCNNDSIGQFIALSDEQVDELLDFAIESLSVVVQPVTDLTDISTYSNNVVDAAKNIEKLRGPINANSTEISQRVEWLRDPSLAFTNMTDTLSAAEFPKIPSTELTTIQSISHDIIRLADHRLQQSYDVADGELRGIIANINYTVRADLSEVLRDLRRSILDISSGLYIAGMDMASSQSDVDSVLAIKTLVVSLFFSLPVLVYLCGGAFTTTTKQHKGLMLSFNLWFLIFSFIAYCVTMGLLLLFAAVVSDGCDAMMPLMRINTESIQFQVGSSQVNLSESIENVLECGVKFTEEPNFAAAFKVQDEFNVTEYVVEDVRALRQAAKDYNQTIPVLWVDNNATAVQSLIRDDLPRTADFAISSVKADVRTTLHQLPPHSTGLDRDNATHQRALFAYYGQAPRSAAPWGFSWRQYAANITLLNWAAGNMSSIPAGYGYPWTNDSVQYFTMRRANASGSPWTNASNYAGGSSVVRMQRQDALLGHVASMDVMSMVLNASAHHNDVNRANASHLLQLLDWHASSVAAYDTQVEDAATNDAAIFTSTGSLFSFDETVANQIDEGTDQLWAIVELVASAPRYLGCTWVGKFFRDVFRKELCNDVRGDLQLGGGASVLLVVFVLFGFVLYALTVPLFVQDRDFDTRQAVWKKSVASRAEHSMAGSNDSDDSGGDSGGRKASSRSVDNEIEMTAQLRPRSVPRGAAQTIVAALSALSARSDDDNSSDVHSADAPEEENKAIAASPAATTHIVCALGTEGAPRTHSL